MVSCEDADGFTTARSRCRRNEATDLSFFRARTAGLSQRERRAEGNSFRNTFDVLADVCPGRCPPTPLTRQGGAETHVLETSVLKPAHPTVHGSYLAAAGGAILAKNIIRSISSTPSTPISDNMLHTRISGVDSALTLKANASGTAPDAPATHMYVRTLNTRHEQIEGGRNSDRDDQDVLMLGVEGSGNSLGEARQTEREERREKREKF